MPGQSAYRTERACRLSKISTRYERNVENRKFFGLEVCNGLADASRDRLDTPDRVGVV
jgi:hypothetical protein